MSSYQMTLGSQNYDELLGMIRLPLEGVKVKPPSWEICDCLCLGPGTPLLKYSANFYNIVRRFLDSVGTCAATKQSGTAPFDWLGKKPELLFLSMAALPEKTWAVSLGGNRAIGLFVQWYKSCEVACSQCWLPATFSEQLHR
jgi:hypothetical protein